MAACPSATQLGNALAGRLAPQENAVVEAHVESCDSCQRLLEAITRQPHGSLSTADHTQLPLTLQPQSPLDRAFVQRLENEGPTMEGTIQPGCEATHHPPQVPGYEIIEKLGRGGMGVVYKVWDVQLKRLAALKMVLAGAQAEPEILARFRIEVEAVARLQHPNIVQIYEVGEIAGAPYCVLEYLEGGNLAEKLGGAPLPAQTAAHVLAQLGRTIQFAHECGIVHRDLKPANILLSKTGLDSGPIVDRPPSQWAVKVTDFGLAKLLIGGAERTRTGAVLGTPSYMAPEQAKGENRDIGPAADIYSLGAILYELLTGRPPFRAATSMETLLLVVSTDPVPPSRLQPRLPRDLETICLKCLEKEPRRRYSSVQAFAEDLERWLAGVPIQARPSGIGERAVKWARRRPAVAGLLALVGFLIIGGFSAVLSQWWRAESALGLAAANAEREQTMRQKAEKSQIQTEEARQTEANQRAQTGLALDRAEDALYIYHLNRSEQLWTANNVRQAEPLLDRCKTSLRGWEWHYLKRLCHADEHTMRHTAGVLSVACSPDGKQFAACGYDFKVQLWELPSCRPSFTLVGSTKEVQGLSYHPDGKYLASACADHSIAIWDTTAGRQVQNWKAHDGEVRCVVYSADGTRLASGGDDGRVRVWDPTDSKLLFTLDNDAHSVLGVAFSPNGRLLASAHMDNRAVIWDLTTKKALFTLPSQALAFMSVAFHPDGEQLASAGADGDVYFWDVSTGKLLRRLKGHLNRIDNLGFSKDGQRLATASWDRTIKVWNLASPDGSPTTLRGHADWVTSVAFRPDGLRLFSASYDRTVKVWPLSESQQAQVLRGHQSSVRAVQYSPDGHLLASAGADHCVKLWDAVTGALRQTLSLDAPILCLAFSADGRRLAAGGDDRRIHLWDVTTNLAIGSLDGHVGKVQSVNFSPDGASLVSTDGESVKVWNLSEKSARFSLPRPADSKEFVFRDVVFSPDGRHILTAGGHDDRGVISVHDASDGQETRTWRAHDSTVIRLRFSADRRHLASVGLDKNVLLWDWPAAGPENRAVRTLQGHNAWIFDIAFSPDGRRLATASLDTTAKLWDLETGKEMLTLAGHRELLYSVAFSPDGHRLATASEDRTLRVWDATPLAEGLADGSLLDEGPAGAATLAYSMDGHLLATARENGRIQLWDVRTGWPTTALAGHGSVVRSVLFARDNRTLATLSQTQNQGGEIRLWDMPSGKVRTTLRSEQKDIQLLAFLPDGKGLAVLSSEGICLWDESSGQVREVMRPHQPERFTAGAVSPDGRVFVAASERGVLYLWDAAGARELPGPPNPSAVIGLEFSADGRLLCCGTISHGIRTWDVATWQEQKRIEIPDPIRSMSLAVDSRTLAVGDTCGVVQRWDMLSGKRLGSRFGYSWDVMERVRFAPDGRGLAALSLKGNLKVWNLSPPE